MRGFTTLGDFLADLERRGDLKRITREVDWQYEVTEIACREAKTEGPALLFERVRGAAFPLAVNVLAARRRIEWAIGRTPGSVGAELEEILHAVPPRRLSDLLKLRGSAGRVLAMRPARTRNAPSQQGSLGPHLETLPILQLWPHDGGRFVTFPLVLTQHPETHKRNLGIYRMHVYDEATTGMHWQIGKGGGFHYARAEARNEALPVTVFLGGPPALILSAIAPLPENVPELMLASLIAGERLPQVTGPNGHPHPLIASAEFALMGQVAPRRRRPEGPFGDHYGYYSLQHDYPVFDVRQIAHRKDAIYPATVVGKPRQEDFFIGDLLQELLSPLFPLVMPAVEQLWSYGETGYHSLAAAVVKQRYKREAMASAFRILGEGQLSLTKFILLTDQRVDLKDFRATLEHVLARTDPRSDLYVFSNLSMDTLDYSGPVVNEGSKGVWLGLGDPVRDLPRTFAPATPPPSDVTDVRVFCGGCLVVGTRSYADDRQAPSRVAAHPAFAGWPLVVVSDEPERATRSDMNFLWTTFTRFEPAADIYSAAQRVVRNHIAYEPPVVIDARMKPWYPAEVSCRPDVASKVSARWLEYFPGGKVEMGDSERGHLD